MNQGCQSAVVDRQGMPSLSQTVATGLVVSGVACTTIIATSSSMISSCATSAARLGLDWLSRTITSNMSPVARAKASSTKASASEKAASGPDCGVT